MSELGLDEERLREAVLSKAHRLDRFFNLAHGETSARITDRFGKRPVSMGVGDLVRVLRWMEESFGDVL